jgi:hypothetical protein
MTATQDQPRQAPPLLHISCGCIWDGDTRLRACPAHNHRRA